MEKKDIADFFDRCAPWWDDDMIRNEVIITTILDNAGIKGGMDVLDVACGTGVLFPDYLKRGVASVTGIDISPEMAKIAASKFPEVQVICGDVEETGFDRQFDAVMVYNAFPHFPEPAKLIGPGPGGKARRTAVRCPLHEPRPASAASQRPGKQGFHRPDP